MIYKKHFQKLKNNDKKRLLINTRIPMKLESATPFSPYTSSYIVLLYIPIFLLFIDLHEYLILFYEKSSSSSCFICTIFACYIYRHFRGIIAYFHFPAIIIYHRSNCDSIRRYTEMKYTYSGV